MRVITTSVTQCDVTQKEEEFITVMNFSIAENRTSYTSDEIKNYCKGAISTVLYNNPDTVVRLRIRGNTLDILLYIDTIQCTLTVY